MTKEDDQTARAQRMGVRALQLAAASMLAVIMVLTVSLVLLLGLTSTARSDAVRLGEELDCRSLIRADFDVAIAELAEVSALAVLAEDLDQYRDRMNAAVEDLDQKRIALSEIVERCNGKFSETDG